jgi:hypothetical protein
MEYNAALKDDVPSYILIERSVYAEYQTFLKNRENEKVVYAHVDSVNVFHFIDIILAQPRNNPLQTFDKYADIESWLRIQWSGLFRELLKERSNEAQLNDLSTQVSQLSEVNQTLRRYLEEVVTKLAPGNEAASLIKAEDERLTEAEVLHKLSENPFIRFLCRNQEVTIQQLRPALENALTIDEFISQVGSLGDNTPEFINRVHFLNSSERAKEDFNKARLILGKSPINQDDATAETSPNQAGIKSTTAIRAPRRLRRTSE